MLKLALTLDMTEQIRALRSRNKGVYECAIGEIERRLSADKTDLTLVILTPTSTDADAQELFGAIWREVDWDAADYNYDAECFMLCKLVGEEVVSIIVEDDPWVEKRFPGLISKLHEYVEV